MMTLDQLTGPPSFVTSNARRDTGAATGHRIGRGIVVVDRRALAGTERFAMCMGFDTDDDAYLELYKFDAPNYGTTNSVWVMWTPRRAAPMVKPGCMPLEPITTTIRRMSGRYWSQGNARRAGWLTILEHCADYEWSPHLPRIGHTR